MVISHLIKLIQKSSLNSLDINKINESLRSSISLSKNLRNKNLKNLELNYFASYREEIDMDIMEFTKFIMAMV